MQTLVETQSICKTSDFRHAQGVKIRLTLLVDEQILIFHGVDLDFGVDFKSSSTVLSISFLELDLGLVAHIHSESYREEAKHQK